VSPSGLDSDSIPTESVSPSSSPCSTPARFAHASVMLDEFMLVVGGCGEHVSQHNTVPRAFLCGGSSYVACTTVVNDAVYICIQVQALHTPSGRWLRTRVSCHSTETRKQTFTLWSDTLCINHSLLQVRAWVVYMEEGDQKSCWMTKPCWLILNDRYRDPNHWLMLVQLVSCPARCGVGIE